MVTAEILEAQAYAKAKVKQSHSSFYWAMRMLPIEKRNAMYAIYAFCRVVDDIADNPGGVEDKRSRLRSWRQEIANTCDDKPSGPVGQALALARSRFGLRQEDFLAIIDGMEMDVGEVKGGGRVRIADLAELSLYCDRVAGAVGRLSNQVFGLESGRGDKLAKTLGRALQLTNILRDLKEDAKRDRLYLPIEMLQRHGIDETEPTRVLASAQLSQVCDEIAIMAEKDFSDAEALMKGLQRTQIRPIVVMRDVYHLVLRRLVRRGWNDLDRSVQLSRLAKLWIVFRSGLLGL